LSYVATFFSDTTSRCAQLNILDIVDILKNNKKLPVKIIALLKPLVKKKIFVKDDSQLKDEYYEFLKKYFYL
jgi:hypothetical protein